MASFVVARTSHIKTACAAVEYFATAGAGVADVVGEGEIIIGASI